VLSQKGGDDCVKLDFGLYSGTLDADAKKAWPYDFGLVYSVTLGPKGLQTVMNVRNEGSEGFEFQVLLHTYLAVEVRIKREAHWSADGQAWLTTDRTSLPRPLLASSAPPTLTRYSMPVPTRRRTPIFPSPVRPIASIPTSNRIPPQSYKLENPGTMWSATT
jgi:galactose mutarotase-like enzyme